MVERVSVVVVEVEVVIVLVVLEIETGIEAEIEIELGSPAALLVETTWLSALLCLSYILLDSTRLSCV